MWWLSGFVSLFYSSLKGKIYVYRPQFFLNIYVSFAIIHIIVSMITEHQYVDIRSMHIVTSRRIWCLRTKAIIFCQYYMLIDINVPFIQLKKIPLTLMIFPPPVFKITYIVPLIDWFYQSPSTKHPSDNTSFNTFQPPLHISGTNLLNGEIKCVPFKVFLIKILSYWDYDERWIKPTRSCSRYDE